MARRTRLQIASGIYHVTARGNRRQAIYLDRIDLGRFRAVAASVCKRHEWIVYAYCLMPNHYHLVLRTPQPDLSAGMQRLNSAYAQWFNRRHDTSGHVFQGRFWSTLVESDAHLLELCRYVALNPVRAGLCDHPAAWRWSSFADIARGQSNSLVAAGEILSYFGAEEARASERYRSFVCQQ